MYWDNSFMDFVILRKKIYIIVINIKPKFFILCTFIDRKLLQYIRVYSTIERFMFNIHEHRIRYTFDNLMLRKIVQSLCIIWKADLFQWCVFCRIFEITSALKTYCFNFYRKIFKAGHYKCMNITQVSRDIRNSFNSLNE